MNTPEDKRADALMFAAFATAPRGARAHLAIRYRLCPFKAIAEHVPRSGDLLEFGCGHGLFSIFLAAESASRRVFGCDIDRAKIAVAEQAAANLPVGNATPIRAPTVTIPKAKLLFEGDYHGELELIETSGRSE